MSTQISVINENDRVFLSLLDSQTKMTAVVDVLNQQNEIMLSLGETLTEIASRMLDSMLMASGKPSHDWVGRIDIAAGTYER